MKAMQIDRYGDPTQLREREVPDPSPAVGQVLIKIQATSVNPIELKRASGAMQDSFPVKFPWTPGADFSGVVESVGSGVNSFKAGDEVFGYTPDGGSYAQKIAVDAGTIARKPKSISHAEAASLALVAQTALQALNAAGVKSGQTVLIHGASGAVGYAAVQLTHLRGATPIVTGSAASLNRLQSAGAKQVVDYQKNRFEDVVKGVDAVIDPIGRDTQTRSFSVLKPNGVLVALTQPPPQEEAEKHQVRAVMYSTEPSGKDLERLTDLIDSGKLKPFIGKSYPLSRAAQAWADLNSKKVDGKIVFDVA